MMKARMNLLVATPSSYVDRFGNSRSIHYAQTYDKHALVDMSMSEIKKGLAGRMSEIGPNGNLYFSKLSEFPRFKLKNTTYRKVNQLADADYVVYKPSLISFLTLYHCGKDETGICFDKGGYTVFISDDVSMSMGFNLAEVTPGTEAFTKRCGEVIDNLLLRHADARLNCSYGHMFVDLSQGIVENMQYGTFNSVSPETALFLNDVFNKDYRNLVKDSQVEKAVNKVLRPLEWDCVKSILDYIDSSEKSARDLGWKLLVGTNFTALPLTTKLLVYGFSNRMDYSTYKSVAMQSLIHTLNIPVYTYNLRREPTIGDITSHVFTEDTVKGASTEDRYMAGLILESIAKKQLSWVQALWGNVRGLNSSVNISIKYAPE